MRTKSASVVVIGAGINGAATALNLLRQGVKDTVLVEKGLLAGGGTGRSAAIIRQHYSNAELVQMVKRSTDIFHHFNVEIGGDAGFVNTGWAFFAPTDVVDGFERNISLGQRLGVDVREIDHHELQEMEPRVAIDDVAKIAYEPGSGYADPIKATHAYIERFVKLGGEYLPLTAVVGLIGSESRVAGVETVAGKIEADAVVNAAGPWAGKLARFAGVDLPLEITREEEVVLETDYCGGPPKLCFSDMSMAIYYRPHGKTQMLVGRGYPKEYELVDPDNYIERVNTSFIEELNSRLNQRWPGFKQALRVNSYTGLYDVTPDWHPILGEVDGVDGFYLCTGFSGHGFKIAPAVGEIMADMIANGETTLVDLRRFNLRRFTNDELFAAAYGGNRA